VRLRDNLNRDLMGLLAMVLLIALYHIQHPTLLFRAQFGRSFRDDSFQQGVLGLFLIALVGLLGHWRPLWQGRAEAAGRLRLVLACMVIAFGLHSFLLIFQGTNLFTDYFQVPLSVLEDPLQERDLLPAMKSHNTTAILGGAALFSLLLLWSPWERPRAPGRQTPQAWFHDGLGLAALVLILIAYHLQNPLLLARTGLGQSLGSPSYQFATALFLTTACLLFFAPYLRGEGGAKSGAMMALISLFVLHILGVVLGGDHFFQNYYNVPEDGYALLTDAPEITSAILALDRAGLFAGMALAAVFYLWAPWERLGVYNESLQRNILPIGIGLLTLVFWEGAIEYFEIKQFLLPSPSIIWAELIDSYPKLIAAGWFTFLNAFQGFLVGCGAGILTGIASARFTKFSTAILPLAIAANSIPIIAFAPIMNIWFGVTSPNSKIAIVAILTYFPAMISTVRGLTSVDKTQLELMRSYAATEAEIFRKLRLPTALPFIFSALKLATTLAMIGSIVSEFFGGSLAGLGYRIREDAVLFRFPSSWSAIIVASLFGISFYMLISALERAAMPWHQSFRDES
jgi:NitT/TauT family transport system permease protein